MKYEGSVELRVRVEVLFVPEEISEMRWGKYGSTWRGSAVDTVDGRTCATADIFGAWWLEHPALVLAAVDDIVMALIEERKEKENGRSLP